MAELVSMLSCDKKCELQETFLRFWTMKSKFNMSSNTIGRERKCQIISVPRHERQLDNTYKLVSCLQNPSVISVFLSPPLALGGVCLDSSRFQFSSPSFTFHSRKQKNITGLSMSIFEISVSNLHLAQIFLGRESFALEI